jgi:hypothetical protein
MAKNKPRPAWASPEGGLVLLAAIVTAAVASMPIVLVPGVLAYGILVYLRASRAAEETNALPAADVSGLAEPYAARVLRTEALAKAILSELEGAAPEHRALLASTGDRVKQLVAAAERLAKKLQQLDRHLGDSARASVERETRALEKQLAAARDPVAKDGYARALEQQKQKEKVLDELSARRERIDAQLVGVEKTLDTTGAQVVRIKSTEGVEAGIEGARIAESLDALAVEMDAAAETVDEAAAFEHIARR